MLCLLRALWQCVRRACGSYSQSHISRDVDERLVSIDLAMASVFAVDYMLRWLAAEDRVMYVFEPTALIDFFTTVPVFIEVAGEAAISNRLSFLRFLRVMRVARVFRILRILRILRVYRVLSLGDSALTHQGMVIAFTVCLCVCVRARVEVLGWVSCTM